MCGWTGLDSGIAHLFLTQPTLATSHTSSAPQVGAAAMAGRWPFLLRHLSRYSTRLAGMSDEEVMAMLKERLAPVVC